MMKYAKPFAFTFVILALVVTACNDNPFEAEQPQLDVQEFEGHHGEALHGDALQATGRTIQNITAELADGSVFTGRIVNLNFTDIDEDGNVLASGRLVGERNGERINETFENVALPAFDEAGDPIDLNDLLNNNNEVCPILFLELGPIFLDVLGLQVIVPDPIVVIIQAVPGPGQLLGNLLCALLGILG